MNLNVNFKDGGTLTCNSLVFDGAMLVADEVYELHPVELEEITYATPSKEQIKKAEQVLIDNGIEPDEATVVLQAIGYTLLDEELYPEPEPEEEQPKAADILD